MSPYLYILLAILGILPSLIWLAVYLRKDCHPEPRSLLAKTFIAGILIAPLVLIFQLVFVQIASWLCGCAVSTRDPSFFMWGAFVEEFFKFYVVRTLILRNPNFDEPVDAMIYMIVAALGFAAMENVVYLSRTVQQGIALDFTFNEHLSATLAVWALRFTGATFLHALASGLMGYFLALAWFWRSKHTHLVLTGLSVATLFHFTFNLFISLPGQEQHVLGLVSSLSLLVALAFLVSILFDKIKERHLQRATLI